MVELFAFRRSFRFVSLRVAALALCSAAIVASASPASARPHHGAGRHARARHAGQYASWSHHHRHYSRLARTSRWDAGVAQMQAHGFADTNASFAPGAVAGSTAASGGFGSSDVVSEARRYIGGNPTGRGRLWCARFMNMVLQRSGHRGTGSDMAKSFASYGQRVSGPQVGAIAVMGRRGGGGHVGVVSGIDASGNPIVVSGNSGNRVREAVLPRSRIYAYVMPTG
jgi:uncharacterized protein (TIGR02594 family)